MSLSLVRSLSLSLPLTCCLYLPYPLSPSPPVFDSFPPSHAKQGLSLSLVLSLTWSLSLSLPPLFSLTLPVPSLALVGLPLCSLSLPLSLSLSLFVSLTRSLYLTCCLCSHSCCLSALTRCLSHSLCPSLHPHSFSFSLVVSHTLVVSLTLGVSLTLVVCSLSLTRCFSLGSLISLRLSVSDSSLLVVSLTRGLCRSLSLSPPHSSNGSPSLFLSLTRVSLLLTRYLLSVTASFSSDSLSLLVTPSPSSLIHSSSFSFVFFTLVRCLSLPPSLTYRPHSLSLSLTLSLSVSLTQWLPLSVYLPHHTCCISLTLVVSSFSHSHSCSARPHTIIRHSDTGCEREA